MTTKAQRNLSATDLSQMAEPELAVWAAQTVVAKPDTALVRYGALVFWTVIAGLLIARVLFVDVAKLRPETSATAAPPAPASLIQLTSGSKF
jgi:hypothetical protein